MHLNLTIKTAQQKKNEKIAKKQVHFASMCKATMSEHRKPPLQKQIQKQLHTKIHINPKLKSSTHKRPKRARIPAPVRGRNGARRTSGRRRGIVDKRVNKRLGECKTHSSHEERNSTINSDKTSPIGVATTINDKEVNWLTDTVSSILFMDITTTKQLAKKQPKQQ